MNPAVAHYLYDYVMSVFPALSTCLALFSVLWAEVCVLLVSATSSARSSATTVLEYSCGVVYLQKEEREREVDSPNLSR